MLSPCNGPCQGYTICGSKARGNPTAQALALKRSAMRRPPGLTYSRSTNSVMPGKATSMAVRTKSLATNGMMAR